MSAQNFANQKMQEIKVTEFTKNVEQCSPIRMDELNSSTGSIGDKFYEDAEKYWSAVPATIDGMLGGFGNITNTDIEGSREFLSEVFKLKSPPGKKRALDCGAGIGRVTKGLLMPTFEKVDMVEQDKAFCEKAKELYCAESRFGNVFNVGLQAFNPESEIYDIVWSQWVLGHLTDDDLCEFFKRVGKSLTKNGLFIIKENVTSSNKPEIDEVDSSMTRPLKVLKKLIKSADFKLIKVTRQANFPSGLYPVYMFACKPMKSTKS